MRRLGSRAIGGTVLVLLAGAGAVTYGVARDPAGPPDTAKVVAVTELDFQVSAPERMAAGDYRLRVENKGPNRHELLVVRKPDAGVLPLRPTGLTIDEQALESAGTVVSILEPGDPGGVRDLRLHLAPGTYEFFCNMAGHYLGGMRADVVVA